MRRTLAMLCILLAAGAVIAQEAKPEAVTKAQADVKAWLTLTDSGKYGESWDAAGSLFKSAVTRGAWEKAVGDVRGPLGAVKSRKLKSATYSKTIPGAPAGDYVIIEYETDFEKQAGTIETATAMLEKDGAWRVVGYFIRPA